MTFARNPGDERTDEAGWPWSHRKTFLERLAAQGYAAVTIQEYRTVSGRFCDIIEKRGLQIGDLDGAATERLRHAVLSGVTGSARSYAKHCARKFIDHLIEVGAASPALQPAEKPTPLIRLRDEYESYLRKRPARPSKRKRPGARARGLCDAAHTESTARVYKENCGKRTELAQPTGTSVDNPVAIRSAAGFGLSRAAFE